MFSFTRATAVAILIAALLNPAYSQQNCLYSEHLSSTNKSVSVSKLDSILSLQGGCDCHKTACVINSHEDAADVVGSGVLQLPKGIPESFQIDLTVSDKVVTLHWEKNSHSKNYQEPKLRSRTRVQCL